MWPRLLTPLGTLDTHHRKPRGQTSTDHVNTWGKGHDLPPSWHTEPLAPAQPGTVLSFFSLNAKNTLRMQTSPKRHRLRTKTRHKKPCIACLQESTRRAHGHNHTDTAATPHLHLNHPRHFFVSFVTEGHFEIKQR